MYHRSEMIKLAIVTNASMLTWNSCVYCGLFVEQGSRRYDSSSANVRIVCRLTTIGVRWETNQERMTDQEVGECG